MPAIKRITVENAAFQQFEALLHNRRKRSRAGLFIVEGVKAVSLAIEREWPLYAVLFSQQVSDWAHDIVDRLESIERYQLSDSLMARLSQREETSELLLVAQLRTPSLQEVTIAPPGLALVIDRPSSPGNLGTILRSTDAFGVDVVALTGHGADLFDPQTVRASVGTLFTQPVVRAQSHGVARALRDRMSSLGEAQIVGTSAKGDLELHEVDFTRPTVLVAGNETTGMSEGYRDLCDVTAKIPIIGAASSLNVACAASICLYEIARQRRTR